MLFLIRGPFLSTSIRLGRNLSKFLSTIKHPVIFCTLALPLSPSVSLAVFSPAPLPFPWPWLPGSWGLAKACVPEGASEEMERGGKAGAERQAPKPQLQQPCLAFLSPVLSLTSLGFARSWPGTHPSSAINQRRGVVCAFVLIENWLERGWYGGPPNKAVEFTQRVNRGGSLSLTDKMPVAQIVTLWRDEMDAEKLDALRWGVRECEGIG